RARVERIVFDAHAAADRHPRFGLRGAPERQVGHGVEAAGNPRLTASSKQRRQRAPRLAARLALRRRRVEPPQLLARGRVVRADETLFLAVRLAAAEPLDHLALGDERT